MLDRSLALLALVLSHQQPVANTFVDTPRAIVVRPSDAVLDGHGPASFVELRSELDARFHLWTADADAALILRVTDATGKSLGEDTGALGKGRPCLELDVEAGTDVRVCVALAEPVQGDPLPVSLSLHVVRACVSAEAKALASRARSELTQIARLRGAGSIAEATVRVSELMRQLLDATRGASNAPLVDVLDPLAFEAYNLARIDLCLTAWERIGEILDVVLPESHPKRWKARQNFAAMVAETGDIPRARELLEQVLAEQEHGLPADHHDLLLARANLANFLYISGELSRAQELLESVTAGFERTLPPEHPDLVKVMQSLAAVVGDRGDRNRALALYERVLEVRARSLAGNDPSLLMAQMNLGVALAERGELPRARSLLEQSSLGFAKILREDHPYRLAAVHNLAGCLLDLGDIVGSRALFESVLAKYQERLGPTHPELLSVRLNLAVALHLSGESKVARELLESTVSEFSDVVADDNLVFLKVRGNLAGIVLELGEPRLALTILEEMEEVYSRSYAEDDPNRLKLRQNEANARAALGEIGPALASAREVVRVRMNDLPADHPDLLRSRISLATMLLDSGDREAALAELPPLLEGVSLGLDASLWLAPREARERVSTQTDWIAGTLALLGDSPSNLDVTVFELLESQRMGPSEIERARALILGDPELAALARGIADRREALATSVSAASTDEVAEQITRLSMERDRLERELVSHLRGRFGFTSRIELASFCRALPKNAIAIGYREVPWWVGEFGAGSTLETEPHLIAHIVHPDGRLHRLDLGSVREATELVVAWREAAGTPLGATRGVGIEEARVGTALELAQAGQRLRQRILDPILKVAGEARLLVACLDGPLHLIPLEVLPMDDGRAVGDVYEIQLDASFARHLTSREKSAVDPRLLALGAIDYDLGLAAEESNRILDETAGVEDRGVPGLPLPRLPETRLEVEELGRIFRDAWQRDPELLTGSAATKRELMDRAVGARFVHVATHGWFAPDSVRSTRDAVPVRGVGKPMSLEEKVVGFAALALCGVALAGANEGQDALGRVPGILTAEELCSLDLSQCELAVLSGCETNVGVVRAGLGIQSLQAALHAAGARTAITSLWKVPDATTRELMVDFYRRLWIEHVPKSQALREAKLVLRARGAPVRDWAAWVLTGEPD